jgi:hypothetical protein
MKNSAIENYVGISLIIKDNHSNSVTSFQFLIELSQMNQAIIKETQSLIINNHSQLIEEFTSISTLVLNLKETLGNLISNLFLEQMKEPKKGKR